MAYGHRYTKEQDDFIRDNYSSVHECVQKFNEKFKTNLSYSAIKAHANRKLKLKTGIRPWTQEMNNDLNPPPLKKWGILYFVKKFGFLPLFF